MSALPAFIAVPELVALQREGADLVVLDVRFDPHHPADGRAGWATGHIPGAIYVDLPTELQAKPVMGKGRRPLPEIEALQATVRGWGIDAGTRVVLYDDRFSVSAGRGWWVLRWAGLGNVQLLDGGITAWTAAGQPLSTDAGAARTPTDIVLTAGHLPVLELDDAAALADAGRLVDARDFREYESGHIPSAFSTPVRELLDESGRVPTPAELRAAFAARGLGDATTVGAYCGGGVAAAFTVALLEHAGVDAALYPGSWSQWSTLPDRPRATGPNPAGVVA